MTKLKNVVLFILDMYEPIYLGNELIKRNYKDF